MCCLLHPTSQCRVDFLRTQGVYPFGMASVNALLLRGARRAGISNVSILDGGSNLACARVRAACCNHYYDLLLMNDSPNLELRSGLATVAMPVREARQRVYSKSGRKNQVA